MSVENLKEYARRCAGEPELGRQAREIGIENIDEHIRVAADMDLDWSWSDLKAFRNEMIGLEDDVEDLSEEELEQVAGGAFSVTLVTSLVVGTAVGAVVGGAVAGAASGAAAGVAAGKGGW